jgi:hypothetical protein
MTKLQLVMTSIQGLGFVVATYFFVMATYVFVRIIMDHRRHTKIMALIKQFDVIMEQARAAHRRGDDEAIKFHCQRLDELMEMIDMERKKF